MDVPSFSFSLRRCTPSHGGSEERQPLQEGPRFVSRQHTHTAVRVHLCVTGRRSWWTEGDGIRLHETHMNTDANTYADILNTNKGHFLTLASKEVREGE